MAIAPVALHLGVRTRLHLRVSRSTSWKSVFTARLGSCQHGGVLGDLTRLCRIEVAGDCVTGTDLDEWRVHIRADLHRKRTTRAKRTARRFVQQRGRYPGDR